MGQNTKASTNGEGTNTGNVVSTADVRTPQPIECIATPFASLALILMVVVTIIGYSSARGAVVKLAERMDLCGSGPAETVIELAFDRGLRLNSLPIARGDLAAALRQVFRHRLERLIFVKASSDASFQDVADLIDEARVHCDTVALITPATDEREGCLALALPGGGDRLLRPHLVDVKPVPLSPWLW